jgi:hypothetical protein
MTVVDVLKGFPKKWHLEDAAEMDADSVSRLESAIKSGRSLCIVCGAVASHWCGRCGVAPYCSKVHQDEDWVEHRKNCVGGKSALEAAGSALAESTSSGRQRHVGSGWKKSGNELRRLILEMANVDARGDRMSSSRAKTVDAGALRMMGPDALRAAADVDAAAIDALAERAEATDDADERKRISAEAISAIGNLPPAMISGNFIGDAKRTIEATESIFTGTARAQLVGPRASREEEEESTAEGTWYARVVRWGGGVVSAVMRAVARVAEAIGSAVFGVIDRIVGCVADWIPKMREWLAATMSPGEIASALRPLLSAFSTALMVTFAVPNLLGAGLDGARDLASGFLKSAAGILGWMVTKLGTGIAYVAGKIRGLVLSPAEERDLSEDVVAGRPDHPWISWAGGVASKWMVWASEMLKPIAAAIGSYRDSALRAIVSFANRCYRAVGLAGLLRQFKDLTLDILDRSPAKPARETLAARAAELEAGTAPAEIAALARDVRAYDKSAGDAIAALRAVPMTMSDVFSAISSSANLMTEICVGDPEPGFDAIGGLRSTLSLVMLTGPRETAGPSSPYFAMDPNAAEFLARSSRDAGIAGIGESMRESRERMVASMERASVSPLVGEEFVGMPGEFGVAAGMIMTAVRILWNTGVLSLLARAAWLAYKLYTVTTDASRGLVDTLRHKNFDEIAKKDPAKAIRLAEMCEKHAFPWLADTSEQLPQAAGELDRERSMYFPFLGTLYRLSHTPDMKDEIRKYFRTRDGMAHASAAYGYSKTWGSYPILDDDSIESIASAASWYASDLAQMYTAVPASAGMAEQMAWLGGYARGMIHGDTLTQIYEPGYSSTSGPTALTANNDWFACLKMTLQWLFAGEGSAVITADLLLGGVPGARTSFAWLTGWINFAIHAPIFGFFGTVVSFAISVAARYNAGEPILRSIVLAILSTAARNVLMNWILASIAIVGTVLWDLKLIPIDAPSQSRMELHGALMNLTVTTAVVGFVANLVGALPSLGSVVLRWGGRLAEGVAAGVSLWLLNYLLPRPPAEVAPAPAAPAPAVAPAEQDVAPVPGLREILGL